MADRSEDEAVTEAYRKLKAKGATKTIKKLQAVDADYERKREESGVATPYGLRDGGSSRFGKAPYGHMDHGDREAGPGGNMVTANSGGGKWIQGAIKHPGRCTPMSKPGCTGAARALAKRFKKGGDLYGGGK